MKFNRPYQIFIEVLKSRFPEKKKLTTTLMDVLSIEREAVYRRMRGEVPFSFGEIALLAKAFHISLDNIVGVGVDTGRASGCQVIHMNFLNNPQKEDYDILETFVFYLKLIKESPYSEFGFVGNTIPQLFYLSYEHLYKLYLLKWDFQTNNPERRKPLREISPPERLKELNRSYQQEIRNCTKSNLIFDKDTFRTLISDILFFYQVRLITKEELKILRDELHALLEEINQIAITGTFNNGQPVDIYISHLNIYTTNLYFHIDTISSLAMFQSFALPDTISMEEGTIEKMKIWLDSFQRSSIQISQSGEAQRIHFFDKQFELLNMLDD